MTRATRLTVLGAIAGICCASAPHAERLTQQVITTPLVDNALDFLYFAVAQRAGLEGWFCLKGYVDPRTSNAILQTIAPVYVDSADGANIIGRPAACRAGADSTAVVGTVHFHPGMNQCEFSTTDIVSAHNLPYQLEAIMCRDDKDTLPHLLVVFRREIDSTYQEIMKLPTGDTSYSRTFTPVYRFRRRPAAGTAPAPR